MTTFAQLSARFKNFLSGWLLVFGLKEGLVECATVCVKSVVILRHLGLHWKRPIMATRDKQSWIFDFWKFTLIFFQPPNPTLLLCGLIVINDIPIQELATSCYTITYISVYSLIFSPLNTLRIHFSIEEGRIQFLMQS